MTNNGVSLNQLTFRESLNDLNNWSTLPPGERKPLLLRGARQVGKSSLVKLFAAQSPLKLVEINLEKEKRFQKIFEESNFSDLKKSLEFSLDIDLNDKKHLLFIDEIQKTPQAIESLRYFYEEHPNCHVIAAGSLLDFALNDKRISVPVGRIQYHYVSPMNFCEFLLALNQKKLADFIYHYRLGESVPLTIHEMLLRFLREYFCIGGMPEAVKIWAKYRDFSRVKKIHRSITDTYRDDFSKYAQGVKLQRIQRIFDKIPAQVGKKVKYSALDPEIQSRDLREALDLLHQARVTKKIFHSDCAHLPLTSGINDLIYKIYALDVGLMNQELGVGPNELESREQSTELISFGPIAEQVVLQNLLSADKWRDQGLVYWLRETKTTNAEVDFVAAFNGEMIPIEVKSGKSGSLRSLHQFMALKKSKRALRFDANPPSTLHVQHEVITSEGRKSVDFELISLPLYLSSQCFQILGTESA